MDTLGASEHHLKINADPFRMKLIAEAIAEYVQNHNLEDDNTLNDFRYNMEVVYQDHHCLMPDNWDYVDNDRQRVLGAF
jgi:hypothetical protein